MSEEQGAHIIGKGPRKVIGLNGWFGHARGWGPMLDSLDHNAFTYAFMDYRGYGGRRGSGGPYTLAQITRDALTLADGLGWERFGLLGHSMGGSAIQHVLADAPERVQALAAVSPVPASGAPMDEPTWNFFSAAGRDAGTRRAIIDLTTGKRLCSIWLDAMVASSLAQSDIEAFEGYLPAWAKCDFAARIQGRRLPVLVVAGEHDPALGADVCRATWLVHYPQARFEVMRNAGHYAMDETPVALATVLESFLREAMPG